MNRTFFFRSAAALFSRCIFPPLGAAALAISIIVPGRAATPPALPGEEITDAYLEIILPTDSITNKTPVTSPTSSHWLDDAMQTWSAPPLATQLGQDKSFIPMGKGAIFVPRMTEGTLEPDVEILDSTGTEILQGKVGQKISLLPGRYFVMLGSGTHSQRIVRETVVEERRAAPVIPDWAGLSVTVVDKNNIPFRGEFEMVRLDSFEPYGRGFGPDPDLGEEPRTWILPPGLYKIFSPGASYNTLQNFVTVQLLPGRLVNFLLIQDDMYNITGGGITDLGPRKMLARNWKYGLDIGGSALFNAKNDRLEEKEPKNNSLTIALLLNIWLQYDKGNRDWNTSLRINEGLSLDNFDFSRLTNTDDDVRLMSLFIWRFLPWLGPYARFQAETDVFPKQEQKDEEKEKYFYIVDENGRNGTIETALSIQSEASFSPISVEAGAGANLDLIKSRLMATKIRIGFGYGYKSIRNKLSRITSEEIDAATWAVDSAIIKESRLLQDIGNARTHKAGPEGALTFDIRLGRLIMLQNEFKVFAPIAPEMRFTRPDFGLESIVSWRLARALTLEYRYNYTLERPEEKDLRTNLSEHRIQIRYSFTSR